MKYISNNDKRTLVLEVIKIIRCTSTFGIGTKFSTININNDISMSNWQRPNNVLEFVTTMSEFYMDFMQRRAFSKWFPQNMCGVSAAQTKTLCNIHWIPKKKNYKSETAFFIAQIDFSFAFPTFLLTKIIRNFQINKSKEIRYDFYGY